MNEGLLVQHQQNPSFIHAMKTYDDNEIMVSSTHHQAAYPFNLPKEDYQILGWTNNISVFHENGLQKEMNPKVECEIVFYPKTNCLGIQPHPEMLNLKSPTVKWFQELLKKFLKNDI